jgi:hypothetical protein
MMAVQAGHGRKEALESAWFAWVSEGIVCARPGKLKASAFLVDRRKGGNSGKIGIVAKRGRLGLITYK